MYRGIDKEGLVSPTIRVIVGLMAMTSNGMENFADGFSAIAVVLGKMHCVSSLEETQCLRCLEILRQGIHMAGLLISSPIEIPVGHHLHCLGKPTGQ